VFLANCIVDWLKMQRAHVPYVLLITSLGLGLWIAHSGGFPSTTFGRIAAALILTCPMFFSGMVFSTLLRSTGEISGMMAMNLLGAMLGACWNTTPCISDFRRYTRSPLPSTRSRSSQAYHCAFRLRYAARPLRALHGLVKRRRERPKRASERRCMNQDFQGAKCRDLFRADNTTLSGRS